MYYFINKVDYIISLLFILYNLTYTDLSIDSSNNLSASITARIPNCPILILVYQLNCYTDLIPIVRVTKFTIIQCK